MKLPIERPARIVIVDDMAASREILSGLLGAEGYELLHANSGVEFLSNLNTFNPDVILLDVMMPGLDGFEVCRRIRANETWQHLPIILITALDDRQDLVDGLDAGADDFLSKPVNGIELRARVRSMLRIKRQFDALKENLQLREDLAHMVVHDLRIPLTAIVGFTELLRGGYISPEDTTDLERLHRQVVRLNLLVNDILVQAKMEHGRLILNRTPVNVNQLVQTVIEGHEYAAQSRELQVIVDLPADPPPVLLDANLFQRVVDNLLSNSLKFSPSGSRVVIRVAYPNGALQLQICDHGPGVPATDRARIFNKYEIVALEHRAEIPIGLGLAYCKLVVDAHGGRIFVEDNQPVGSVFTVEI